MAKRKPKVEVTTIPKKEFQQVIHVGQRVKQLAIDKGYSVDELAKWFQCERSNMYHKLKNRDWKMSDILIAAGHMNIAPYMLMTDQADTSAIAIFNAEPESIKIKELQEIVKNLTIENNALKDKLITVMEKSHRT